MTHKADGNAPRATAHDVDAARRRYVEERERRLAVDRPAPLELTGNLARYLDDPYIAPVARESLVEDLDAVIVGAGFGGLMAGARLREAGLQRIRLIDTAGGVGGVWYWNRYPGAMCDVESYIYLPLLEEIGEVPEFKYSNAPVILEHARRIAHRYALAGQGLFHTAVSAATWDGTDHRWSVTTDRGDRLRARFLVFAVGSLSRPRLPAIAGIDTFAGPAFHTSRWEFDVTGGDGDTQAMEKLADKRVGIVGTGATAVQCVPPLGRSAKELYVFQRTPSTVTPRNNQATDPEWAAGLPAGWQRERMLNFLTWIDPRGKADVDLVGDAWTEAYRKVLASVDPAASPSDANRARDLADFEWMEKIRGRVSEVVTDVGTAQALQPWYPYLCKRPCFHDEYLAAFNLPSVHLIDTHGRGLNRVYEGGVEANGQEFPLDVLIFATGFDAGETSAKKFGADVVGRGGQSLSDKWRSGLRTFHGVMTAGFPNLFFTAAPFSQSTRSPNFMHHIIDNADHFGRIVSEMLKQGGTIVEPSLAAEDAWVNEIVTGAQDRLPFLESCTPGRANHDGRLHEIQRENADYGGGVVEFLARMEDWRNSETLEGLEISQ